MLPHDSVASADQDAWIEIAELIRNNLLRILMKPDLTCEEIVYSCTLAHAAMEFHRMALSFDDRLDHLRTHCNNPFAQTQE